MNDGFRAQLIAVRDKKHSKDHPFFNLWAEGKLTKEQTALYCIQHHHYVVEYINWMAYEASQIVQNDVKAYLLENLWDEENPQERHLDFLVSYVEACGLKRQSIQTSAVLPGTEGLQNWGWRLVHQRPWPIALAGMFVGLESQFLDICRKVVPALHTLYGFPSGGREIHFFEEHLTADEIHAGRGFAIVEKYCATPELQQQAIQAVEEATIRRWRYMNGIYWYSLHGREDDTP